MKRASQTAQMIGSRHHLPITTDAIWRERDIGDFGGLTSDEARSKFAEVWQNSVNGRLEPPDGESFAELEHRVQRAFDQLAAQFEGKMVAIVSHGQFIHVLCGQIMKIRPNEYGRFSIRGNTGINMIEIHDGIPIVTRLNDTAHLE